MVAFVGLSATVYLVAGAAPVPLLVFAGACLVGLALLVGFGALRRFNTEVGEVSPGPGVPKPVLAPHIANGTMRKLAIPELAIDRRFILHRRRSGVLPEAARQFVQHFPLESEMQA